MSSSTQVEDPFSKIFLKSLITIKSIRYLHAELALMFKSQFLINDIFASLCVALIAIPICLAVAMSANVSPAIALISAITGGITAAIFGGTRYTITGPAIGMSILIAECIQNNGLPGLFIIGLTCGILQIGLGIFKIGHFVKLIPLPVISAFIAAIGFFICVEQIALSQHLSVYSRFLVVISQVNITFFQNKSIILTLITIIIIFIATKIFPKNPVMVLAVIIPTMIAHFFNLPNVSYISNIPHSLFFTLPKFNFSGIHLISAIQDGVAVFIIGSLETILSAAKVDTILGRKTLNLNQEFIGQGMANIVTATLGGIPVAEVVARSSVNVNSGAKTRRAAIFHSLIIFLVIYFCPGIITLMPTAVLVGILISAALSMMNFKKIFDFWRHDKLDAITYIVTFFAIICTDLIIGIEIGIILSLCIVSMRLLATKISMKFSKDKNIARISLNGNLTFWALDKLNNLQEQLLAESQLRFVIFEFANLIGVDSTGAKHLLDIATEINTHNIKVIFHGLNNQQQRLINAQLNSEDTAIPYIATIAESDIKNILEESGIKHTANDLLKHGMAQFQQNYASNNQELLDKLAKAQNPHTLLITCSDSRLDPNAFLNVSLGEIFVVRNVGNVIPVFNSKAKFSESAAIEFAIDVLKIRNIVICAHTECGAIKASLANLHTKPKSGLDNWLQIIKDGFKKRVPHDAKEGVEFNLLNQLEHLKTYPNIQELLKQKLITISAWVYDVHSAKMLEWDGKEFIQIVADASSVI